jgi:uncharacterized protein (DUF2147 family)
MRALMVAMSVLTATPAPEPGDAVVGVWKDDDRGVLTQVSRAPDGTWRGVVLGSVSAKEVGKVIFPALKFDPAKQAWTGEMVKPDDDQRVSATLTAKSPTQLECAVKVFIFSKTLVLTRQAVPDAGVP